jgi:bacterioferritin
MIEFAVGSEQGAVKLYNDFALECSANADSASKSLFEALVLDEERHYSQFDDEMGNLKKFGDKYLALQSIERSRSKSMPAGHPGA